jgi:hypothetical protein
MSDETPIRHVSDFTLPIIAGYHTYQRISTNCTRAPWISESEFSPQLRQVVGQFALHQQPVIPRYSEESSWTPRNTSG